MVTNEGKAGSKRSICHILHPTTDKTWGGEPGQKKYSTMIKKKIITVLIYVKVYFAKVKI